MSDVTITNYNHPAYPSYTHRARNWSALVYRESKYIS